MTVRVEPHAYPTIPGQATNEGGGQIPVSYLNLDLLYSRMKLDATAGPDYYVLNFDDSRVFSILNVEIVDISGVSVIEEFEVISLNIKGTKRGEPSTSYEISLKDPVKFAYSVGSNINREVTKNVMLTCPTAEGSVMLNMSGLEVSGQVKATVKVVNASGTILQKKTVDCQVVI